MLDGSASISAWPSPRAGCGARPRGLVDQPGATSRSWTSTSQHAQQLEPADGDQPRVAGPGADEEDRHAELLPLMRRARRLQPASALEVLAPLLVGREVPLRPGAKLPQLGGERGCSGRRRRRLAADLLRERGRGAAGRDCERDRARRCTEGRISCRGRAVGGVAEVSAPRRPRRCAVDRRGRRSRRRRGAGPRDRRSGTAATSRRRGAAARLDLRRDDGQCAPQSSRPCTFSSATGAAADDEEPARRSRSRQAM